MPSIWYGSKTRPEIDFHFVPQGRAKAPFHVCFVRRDHPMSEDLFESLDALVAKLPFHIDDVAAVNDRYVRWFELRSKEDQFVIDLWTYCFIRRYFLIKLVQESSMGPADFDELVDRTFQKIESSVGRIKRPTHYANWVSVVCKNTFLNYLRDRRRSIYLEEEAAPLVATEPARTYGDVGHIRAAVNRAIDRLPKYLRECARLRFIDGMSYEEISRRTGFPLPRIRSYINKAMKRFRDDDRLLAYLNVEE